MKAYTLSELCWIQETGMFRDDARKVLKELGISQEANFAIFMSDALRDKDPIKLWRDYGGLCGDEIELFFEHCLKSYPTGWPHNK